MLLWSLAPGTLVRLCKGVLTLASIIKGIKGFLTSIPEKHAQGFVTNIIEHAQGSLASMRKHQKNSSQIRYAHGFLRIPRKHAQVFLASMRVASPQACASSNASLIDMRMHTYAPAQPQQLVAQMRKFLTSTRRQSHVQACTTSIPHKHHQIHHVLASCGVFHRKSPYLHRIIS